MTRQSRRTLYLLGAGLLVAALVGGRWLAVETAERAWDRTFPGGAALIHARDLGRLLQGLVLLVAIGWITANLLIVYRAIGSVQMPRRLGDLEIVEALPQRTLLGATVVLGVILGVAFSLGTGDWWRHALLAATPPRFGLPDRSLGHDVGYYVSVLPWLAALQKRALLLSLGALAVVVLLYGIIGSLRIRRGRLRASDHARRHAGVLLAILALVVGWGAVLDPAEVVGGLHGVIDQAALSARVPGSGVIAAVAVVTAVLSLAWAWRDRPTLILAAWAALLVSVSAGYFVIPGVVRASAAGGPESAELQRRRLAFERVAFGLDAVQDRAPPAFASGDAAVRAVPLWDAAHLALAFNVPPAAVALRPAAAGEPATWLIAPTGKPAPVRIAAESDTGLAVTSLPRAEAPLLFGPGLGTPVIVSADTSARPLVAGVPITGAWRRFAIAWTIQAWSLLRADSAERVLLWRRDVTERLQRLAPFARFGAPAPCLENGALWWVSWGYVSHADFPFVRPLPWRGGDVRYLRAGVVGAVRVATGETHIWLAPGYDSLTAAWARRFEPLIEPVERLPADLLAQLAYPSETFAVAVAQLLRVEGDSAGPPPAGWSTRPSDPFAIPGPLPPGGLWSAIGLESGQLVPKQFVGLFAATMTRGGPEIHLWRPLDDPDRLPGELVGSSQLRPGQLRMWPVSVIEGGRGAAGATTPAVMTIQAQIFDPIAPRPPAPPPRVAEVYVTLAGRAGHGLTARAALRGGEQMITDTTLAARWERARRLAIQADSALGAGNLEQFGRLWRQLMSELAPPRRPR